MRNITKAHLGLLGTNLFFAFNVPAVKYLTAKDFGGPYGLNLIRIAVSVLLFWAALAFAKHRIRIEKKDWIRLVLCALAALAVNQMLFMKGISYTYSIHCSLLLLITPILITLFASWVLKEKITFLKMLGLGLGITGAVILISSGKNTGAGNNVLLGDILIILSTISYTIYFILVKPLMQKYPAIEVMRWTFTFGLFMILPMGWKEMVAIDFGSYGSLEWVLLFMIVVPGTILAYIFNAYGIKVLGASTAGSYIYLQPVFAVITAVAFLGEALVLYKIIAAVLIFAGVYLANAVRPLKRSDGSG